MKAVIIRISSIISLILFCFLFFGCSSSDEVTNKDQENIVQIEDFYKSKITNLTSAVDSLKKVSKKLNEELQKSQQDNSNLTIQLSEAQKELNNLATRPPENKVDEARQQEYTNALILFNSKKYQEALEKFQKMYIDDPTNEYAPNCIYWVGECYYGLKSYEVAIKSFETVLSAYPGSKKTEPSLIMLGNSYSRCGDKKLALEYYTRLVQLFPESEYIQKIPKGIRISIKKED